MCGRIALYSDPPRYAALLDAGLDPELDGWQPQWNVGPTSPVPGASEGRDGSRTLRLYRWGLVPRWANDLNAVKGTFNARAETVATKPAFQSAFQRGRVLLPADAFYEWEHLDSVTQPYVFRRADGEPIVFAGLAERWKQPDGDILRSATIITTRAGPDMDGIHDRMPVVLERGTWDLWLDRTVTDRDELESMLCPAPEGTLVHHAVGRAVGSTNNNGPQLLDPVEISRQPTLLDPVELHHR